MIRLVEAVSGDVFLLVQILPLISSGPLLDGVCCHQQFLKKMKSFKVRKFGSVSALNASSLGDHSQGIPMWLRQNVQNDK